LEFLGVPKKVQGGAQVSTSRDRFAKDLEISKVTTLAQQSTLTWAWYKNVNWNWNGRKLSRVNFQL